MYDIRLHVVPTANDDGSNTIPVTVANIAKWLVKANAAFAKAGFRFLFDPATDLEPRRNSTLLNFDTTVAPGTDLETPADQKPPQDHLPHEVERNRVAQEFPGKLVLFYCAANQLVYTGTRWQHLPYGGGGFSGGNLSFVRMAFDASDATNTVPHEIAHYFHLDHTHTAETHPEWQNLAGVKRAIKWWVEEMGHDPDEGLGVWDGDRRAVDALPPVHDTNPDPGPDMYKLAGLDICDPSQELTVSVELSSGTRDYTFHPDRRNVVSYWDTDCAGGARLSADQVVRVRAAVEKDNRQHLIASRVLYDAVLDSNGSGQTRALGWSQSDFAKRFDAEQKAGRHLVATDAFGIGPGQIRHNGVWEPGDHSQTRAFGWTHDDFLARTEEEFASRRFVHLQSYNLDGTPTGVHYDGVWEPASFAQSTALGWTLTDIGARVRQELKQGNHLTHLQAVNLDETASGVRYDAIFAGGDNNQTFAIGWAREHFSQRNVDEQAKGRRLVHLQSYDIGAGQYRYDAVWEAGDPLEQGVVTGWELRAILERVEVEAASGRGITHLQAQPMPGHRLRWDAVFAKVTGTQRRVFALSLSEMARQLSSERLATAHLGHLRGYLTA